MDTIWKCLYIDHACGTHGLCKKCRPTITVTFQSSHGGKTGTVHFQTTPEHLATCLSAMKEMLVEFFSNGMITAYHIFIE